MQNVINYTKQLKVQGAYDVVVAGSGPAGICAAVAASREGEKVALVERYDLFFAVFQIVLYEIIGHSLFVFVRKGAEIHIAAARRCGISALYAYLIGRIVAHIKEHITDRVRFFASSPITDGDPLICI